MFKIGEFSNLTRISVKTLRWYDEIGLLKPARVDPETGYRYYLARQIGELTRILLLKNLGFSLNQVRVMLDGNISGLQIRSMLEARRSQLVDQLQKEQERLSMVENWLQQTRNEGGELMSQSDILIKQVDPVTVYSKRQIVPEESQAILLLESVWNDLAAANARKIGPSITVYHQLEYREHDLDIEAAIPVAPGCGLKTTELPAIEKAASIVYYGSHDGLNTAYAALAQWIEENGYQMSGYCRTLFLTCGEQEEDPDKYVTEIQLPVTLRSRTFPCAARGRE